MITSGSGGLTGPVGQPVDRPAADSGQRGTRLLGLLTFADEERPDEVAGVQSVLGQHGAHPAARSTTAHAEGGKTGIRHRRAISLEPLNGIAAVA